MSDLDAFEQKVLNNFLVNGRLRAIPAKKKKRDVILQFLADQFEPDRMYSEQEVSRILAEYHEDYASLRRWLVDTNLLERRVVRIVDAEALMRGTPEVDHQISYWRPSRQAMRAEGTW